MNIYLIFALIYMKFSMAGLYRPLCRHFHALDEFLYAREAGGAFGKMEAAREDEYFYRQQKEQMKKIQ